MALIALLAFAQASVALAACPMGRGDMGPMAAGEDCCDLPQVEPEPRLRNVCVTHCTADLQVSAPPFALVRAPADTAVLFVVQAEPDPPTGIGLATPPPIAVPARILLHAFLI